MSGKWREGLPSGGSWDDVAEAPERGWQFLAPRLPWPRPRDPRAVSRRVFTAGRLPPGEGTVTPGGGQSSSLRD